MNNKQKVIEQIFSDAHVIDIDFSKWDKFINLVVLADHVEDFPLEGRAPAFVVKFHQVKSLHFDFNHFKIKLDNDQHYQWTIYDFEISWDIDEFNGKLYAGEYSPIMQIICKDVDFQKLSNKDLDRLLPGWNKPFSALARPSIEEMINVSKDKRRKG